MRVSPPRSERRRAPRRDGFAVRSLAVSASPPSPAYGRRVIGHLPAHRPGFSLIEVVAATIILGMLSAGLILASGRMRKHEALMQRKQQAVALADRLATAKTTTPGQDAQLAWTVTPQGAPALLGTGITQYHLAILNRADHDAELTSVDFLVKTADGDGQKAEGARKP